MSASVLVTKVHVPKPQPGLVDRPRLIQRVAEGTQRRLTLLSALPGSGKTALLSAWAAASPLKVAWLSLDASDDNPIQFWTYVIAALQRLQADLGQSALSFLHGQAQSLQPFPTEQMAALLFNDLAAFPNEYALILDDYHLIEDQSIHDGVVFLLDHLPPKMHLILASRTDPPFPLARFRTHSLMTELRAADLRFTLDEAVELLNQNMGLNLSPEDISDLEARTEGWIAGLQAAALSLQGRENPHDFVRTFTGSQRYVMDFLIEEVLRRQPESIQLFLLQTAILDRLSGPLCDALTGRSDAQEMLQRLERANLFLVPLDEERRWYRYHHLFADLLLVRLQSAYPGQVPELHRKAAAWFEAAGWINDAVRHALAAGEPEWVASLVEQHVEALLQRGEGDMLRRWLALLPQSVVQARPRLALAQAIAALNVGHLQTAERFLDDAERAGDALPAEPYEPSIGPRMSMLVNVPASIALLRAALAALRGDAERTAKFVRSAETHLKEAERGPHVSVRWNLAQANWMRGSLAEAERAFAGLVAEGQETGQPHLVLTAAYELGHIQRAQGRLGAAFRTYQRSLDFAASDGSGTLRSAAVAHEGLAEVLYERNDLEPAMRHARESVSLGRQLTSTRPLATGLAVLAWIQRAMGDPDGASATMDEAYDVMPDPEIVALHNPVPAERARLWLAQGNLPEVAGWVEARRLEADDEPQYVRERDYLVLARYLLKRRQVPRALALLERLSALAKSEGRLGSVFKIQILQALGLQAAGKLDLALSALSQALMQAEPEGYVRTFLDEGRPMAALLHHARSRDVMPDYTARLLAAFPSADQGAQAAPVFSEPLSDRELEILRLVASGASNQEIAETLSIALTTARKHVSNILGKLGVHNRTQAASRGRDLGLL